MTDLHMLGTVPTSWPEAAVALGAYVLLGFVVWVGWLR